MESEETIRMLEANAATIAAFFKDVPVAVERRSGKDRRKPGAAGERRKVERRINEYVLEPDVLEFINAVNEYKSVNQRPFPTWTEVFKILISLGYRKVD